MPKDLLEDAYDMICDEWHVCVSCEIQIGDKLSEGMDEVRRRVSDGEYLVDLCVEYNNRLLSLLEKDYGDYENADYWYLTGAVNYCQQELSELVLSEEGWEFDKTKGQWVK